MDVGLLRREVGAGETDEDGTRMPEGWSGCGCAAADDADADADGGAGEGGASGPERGFNWRGLRGSSFQTHAMKRRTIFYKKIRI